MLGFFPRKSDLCGEYDRSDEETDKSSRGVNSDSLSGNEERSRQLYRESENRIWQLAARAGIGPRELKRITLRELHVRADTVLIEKWDHTATLESVIDNLNAKNVLFSDAKVYAMPGFHQIYFYDINANMLEVNQSV